MPILSGDVKLLKSAIMSDAPESGGAPTGIEIVDGVSNAIFPDISELDRAGGRVNLRKTFVSVQTDDTDTYFGSNVIVAEPPKDPRVSVTLFTNRQTFDRRADAASRVEAYLNAGPEFPGYLYENHITGQRSIQIFQRPSTPPPPVGRTLLLRQNEGTGTQFEQYVRITRVEVQERTFTVIINGSPVDYQANVVTCDLSDALRFDFTGSPASRTFTPISGSAKIRDTVVADAATYYGAVPLAQPASLGSVEARVASIYTNLVPAAQSENPLVDQSHSAGYAHVLATSPRLVSVSGSPKSHRIKISQENRGFNYTAILKPLPAPGSVRIVYRALGNTYELTDSGSGTLTGAGSGTISYTTGNLLVTLQEMPDDRSAVLIYWGPNEAYTNRSGAVDFLPPAFSVTLQNSPVTPNSFSASWLSGGTLYSVADDGTGRLSGSGGSGNINYATGEVFIRPTKMIDPGGEVQLSYTWADVVEETFTGLTPDASGVVGITLSQTPVPRSIELRWITSRLVSASSGAEVYSGSTTKRVANGSFTDYVIKNSGWVGWYYEPTTVHYSSTSATGSFYSTKTTQTSNLQVSVEHTLTDDGAGGFFDALGTVSYAAKAIAVKVVSDFSETTYSATYERGTTFDASLTGNGNLSGTSSTIKGGNYSTYSFKEVFASNSLMVRYRTGAGAEHSATETYTPPGIVLNLTPYTKEIIVPNSVRFTWMGTTYDDFEGVLYRGRTDTNPGVASGRIDYFSGLAYMDDYVVGTNPGVINIQSLWTRKGLRDPVAAIAFNTELSPIKPTGIVVSVVDQEGTQLTASPDLDGKFESNHIYGQIDYESGLVELQFGDWVLDASLTPEEKAEWWYDPADVVTSGPRAGKIWRPWPVLPETLRYNAIAYTYLPLDSTILGIDPVRLPSDGRVPIFRPGGFAVVGHTGSIGPITVSNGQTIDCGRVRLSRVRVIDSNGQVVYNGYVTNLEAGTVTFTDVSGYSQPVTIEHRIEDMVLVSDAQITGRLKFTRPLTHDYPLGSYVSSALIAGDLYARVSLVFDQASWNGVFSDTPGSPATATFNSTTYPITVTNRGAITERWVVRFTNSTAFEVIGENVGVIATGNTSTDCAPLNPNTGAPYFTIPALGWGSGWATGNVLRFNTIGAMFPVWIVRTVQQGPETVTDDNFTILIRGDVDTP